MSEIAPEWMTAEIDRLIREYGAVPPPWVAFPDTHPYSICWRMGAGEGHIMVFGHWWQNQNVSEDERIAYFRKWPPPPRWLAWMTNAVWDVESDDEDEETYLAPYFEQVERLGFGTKAEYEEDLDDPQWLDE